MKKKTARRQTFWQLLYKIRFLLYSFLILAGLIYFVVPLLASLSNKAVSWYFDHQALELQQRIERDKQQLLNQAQSIAAVDAVKNLIIKHNAIDLLSVLNDERQNRQLGPVMATDQRGVVLTRTVNLSRRGDYVFNTTPWGAEVSQGRDVKSVEYGLALPFIIIAGSPVYQGAQMVGAIFTSQPLDDNYATQLKKDYLNPLSEIFFFSERDGLVGTSLQDKKYRQLLNYGFSAGKSWLHADDQTRIIKVNDRYFYFRNIVLPGLTDSNGGLVLMSPFSFNLFFIGVSLIFCLLFFIGVYLFHRYFRRRWSLRRHLFFIGFTTLATVLLFYFSYLSCKNYVAAQALVFNPPSYTIYNSTLHLYPEQDIFDRSFQQKISIKLDSGGEPINTARVVLNYDPRLAAVTDIVTTNSFCHPDMFLEKDIDNQRGVVTIACSAPSPGFAETNGTVADLLLQPLTPGVFTLTFGPETQILANDGLGTNVLREVVGGSYQIAAPEAPATVGGAPAQVLVFSPTHPNNERWYKNKNINLTWLPQNGVSFAYDLNQIPAEKPYGGKENLTTVQHSVRLSAPGDGIYYFHIAAFKNGVYGPTTEYKMKVDTTPPQLPTIKISSNNPKVNSIVRFEFSGRDRTSGIQPNFYVKLDDSIWLPSTDHLETAFTSAGTHQITVRVFDNAGNYSDTSVSLSVKR